MTDIRNYTLEELQEVFKNWQVAFYHSRQIFFWLYRKAVSSFDAMTNLSSALRERLKKDFVLNELKLVKARESADGSRKFLFRLIDGNLIEAVLIPAPGRYTACLSTQVGCKYGCEFCASGLAGFRRNLDAGEIISQALEINRGLKNEKISHIVFMGSGEPLDNYDNLLRAIRIINSKDGLNIGARRITISTSGIIPGIERLTKENLQIELSVSLHASDDKARSRLMPVNKKYHLKELISTCKKYSAITGRQVTFEYVLIKDVNCSYESANSLVEFLKGWTARVNLIPYNPIPEFSYQPPKSKEILSFRRQLEKAGIPVTIRRPRGKDIEGACGQLRALFFAMKPVIIILFLIFSHPGFGQTITQRVCFENICLQAELADSESKRQIGLMFRNGLADGEGMLFIFDSEEKYSFWMKNMKFPLDIIWIDKDKNVVDIKTEVSPCKNSCESITPQAKARYVLEANAGFVEKNEIKIGDKVRF